MKGEGIGIDTDGSVLLDSEGVHSQVLRYELPERVRQLVGLAPSPSASQPASPSATTSARPQPAVAATTGQSSADHAAYWLAAAVVLLVAAVAVTAGRRRRRH